MPRTTLESVVASVTIVGSTETDPAAFKISDESPIGKALLNGKPGDEVEAETPAGPLKMKILEIL